MSIYLDYAGRTVDISVFRAPGDAENADLTMSLFGDDGGQVCTGIQKLAQRWVLEFFTVPGSMPYEPDRGARLVQKARGGSLLTELDVFQQFNLDYDNIQRGLVNEEGDSDPADERYAGSSLDSVTIGGDYLTLGVSIYSRAGSARPVILPVSLSI